MRHSADLVPAVVMPNTKESENFLPASSKTVGAVANTGGDAFKVTGQGDFRRQNEVPPRLLMLRSDAAERCLSDDYEGSP